MAKSVMERMKFPAKTIDLIHLLVYYHDSHPNCDADVKRLLGNVESENFFRLLRVMEADALSHGKWVIKKRLAQIRKLKESGERIISSGECYSLKNLAITGNDLAEHGVKGQRIGQLLRLSLQNVILGTWENRRDALLYELEKNNW